MKRQKLQHLIGASLCLAALAWVAPATAQNVYRCGNSYSQQPCADGKLIAASDSRSAVQKSQTDEAVKRDAKAANEMEKARLKAEEKPAQALLPPPKASEPVPPQDRSAAPARLKKPQRIAAVPPKKPGDAKKKKKKAKKNADQPV
jgi:hypothetical protein